MFIYPSSLYGLFSQPVKNRETLYTMLIPLVSSSQTCPEHCLGVGGSSSPGWRPALPTCPWYERWGQHSANWTVVINAKLEKKSHMKTTSADRSHNFIRVFWTNVVFCEKLLQKRHWGILFSTLSNNTAYQGGRGEKLFRSKHKHGHRYALCGQVFTKKYIVFNK